MGTREISTAGFLTPDAGGRRTRISARAFEPHLVRNRRRRCHRGTADSDRADPRWLAALGQHIAAARTIPNGLPYAAASSAGWKNAPVLGELVFHAFYATFSDRGFVLAQVAAVVAAFIFLARDMRAAGAGDAARGLVLIATLLAAAPALLVVRAQLLSLALFLSSPSCFAPRRELRRGESGSLFPSSTLVELARRRPCRSRCLSRLLTAPPHASATGGSSRCACRLGGRAARDAGAPGHGRLLPRRADG